MLFLLPTCHYCKKMLLCYILCLNKQHEASPNGFSVYIFSGSYFYSATETKLVVDTSRGERLRVNVSSFLPINLSVGYLLYFYSFCFKETDTYIVVWQCLTSVFCNTNSNLQFDITFPSIPCTLLSIDTTDISGEQHHDIVSSEVILFCDALLIYFLIFHIMVPLFPFPCRGMTSRREDQIHMVMLLKQEKKALAEQR